MPSKIIYYSLAFISPIFVLLIIKYIILGGGSAECLSCGWLYIFFWGILGFPFGYSSINRFHKIILLFLLLLSLGLLLLFLSDTSLFFSAAPFIVLFFIFGETIRHLRIFGRKDFLQFLLKSIIPLLIVSIFLMLAPTFQFFAVSFRLNQMIGQCTEQSSSECFKVIAESIKKINYPSYDYTNFCEERFNKGTEPYAGCQTGFAIRDKWAGRCSHLPNDDAKKCFLKVFSSIPDPRKACPESDEAFLYPEFYELCMNFLKQ